MYTPGNVPSDPSAIPVFLRNELQKIARASVDAFDILNLSIRYAPPAKVRDGLIVAADGTKWNPGSGAGVYHYRSGSWHYLG